MRELKQAAMSQGTVKECAQPFLEGPSLKLERPKMTHILDCSGKFYSALL